VTASPTRLRALDVVRGGVMFLMVLDHARDFYNGFGVDPTDMATTTPVLFFTRWVTHFCAPGFVLLAGASAYLYGRKRTSRERAWFLLSRGLWLIVLEVTIIRFGWIPDPTYRFTMLQVFWAIGASMVLLAPLSMLPPKALAIGGFAMVALHNTLDPIETHSFVWAILHQRDAFEPIDGHMIRVSYPLIPWVGVMALGFGLGELYTRPVEERRRWALGLGIAITVFFVVLRATNVYGDPSPWLEQRDATYTLLSFLDCTKYPPSLLYLAMTLGPTLIVLAALEYLRVPEWILRPLEIYGRVPLFFYVAHIYLLRVPGLAFAYARWGDGIIEHMGSPEWPLVWSYVAWALALAVLLPLCLFYGRWKERRARAWWISYV
jgi:uncharacterized membrane protein